MAMMQRRPWEEQQKTKHALTEYLPVLLKKSSHTWRRNLVRATGRILVRIFSSIYL
jgi:hypothetical protein